jgi:hypothetical protein
LPVFLRKGSYKKEQYIIVAIKKGVGILKVGSFTPVIVRDGAVRKLKE